MSDSSGSGDTTETRDSPCRALLVSLNVEDAPHPVYPLALEYLRAALRDEGHEVHILDRYAAADAADLAAAAAAYQPSVVLVSIRNIDNNDSVSAVNYVPETCAGIKAIQHATGVPLVLGGSGYSLFPREILRLTGADYGVVGPGDDVIGPLVRHLLAGSAPDALPGLVYRRGEEILVNAPVRLSRFSGAPDRDAELVRHYWAKGGVMNVQVRRGCPYACLYCTYPYLEGREVVERETGSAVDEIQRLHECHGVDSFFMVDSVFNMVPAQARAFAEEIVRRGLRIHWTGFFIPKHISLDDARLWRESGLESVEFGTDTMCASLLAPWGKQITVPDIEESSAHCAAAGLPYSHYLVFGGPGETRETLEETIARADTCEKTVIFVFVGMRVYPMTQLYELAVRDGVVEKGVSLLGPTYYISPDLDREYLASRCGELSRRRNWVVAGRSLELRNRIALYMRRRGHKGSLWHRLTPASNEPAD